MLCLYWHFSQCFNVYVLIELPDEANNLQAKDNFYSAETVLDEIRVHMEEQDSSSLGTAYTQILENYDDTSVAEKESKLRYSFFKQHAEGIPVQ